MWHYNSFTEVRKINALTETENHMHAHFFYMIGPHVLLYTWISKFIKYFFNCEKKKIFRSVEILIYVYKVH